MIITHKKELEQLPEKQLLIGNQLHKNVQMSGAWLNPGDIDY